MFISSGDYDMDACKVSAIIVLTTEGSKQKKKEKRRELASIGITQQQQ